MTEKKYSVDLTKKLITSLVKTADEVISAKKDDGKISKIELIGLGDNAVAIGSSLLKIGSIKNEVLDADSEERKELIDHIVSLGVMGEKAEIILVNTYQWVEGQVKLYEQNIVPVIEAIRN